MRQDISNIPEHGLQQEIDIPITINDNTNPYTAHVFIRIFKLGKKILVEGSVKISVSLKCSRCLREFPYPLDLTFRDEYNPAEEMSKEYEKELTNKELDLSFYNNDEIDITEIVKEQVLLSLPMKPLCKSVCQGICPNCGKDLNVGKCQCKIKETDPRLAPLKKFKELMKDRRE